MTYSHTLTVSIADTEIEVEVEFTSTPGCPEQGPTYSCGGQPAEPAEIEIQRATVCIGKERHPAPGWLIDIIHNDEDQMGDLWADVEDDGPDPDAAYDQMGDERDAA